MSDQAFAAGAAEAISNVMSLNKKTWRVYVPHHKQQQLQEQSACCIGVQALLTALGVNFDVIEAANAEWMAKNGQVPVLIGNKTSKEVYSGWRKIVEMLEANKIQLCPAEHRQEQKVLLKMMDAIQRVELYHSWMDQTTVANVTKGFKNILIIFKILFKNATHANSMYSGRPSTLSLNRARIRF